MESKNPKKSTPKIKENSQKITIQNSQKITTRPVDSFAFSILNLQSFKENKLFFWQHNNGIILN